MLLLGTLSWPFSSPIRKKETEIKNEKYKTKPDWHCIDHAQTKPR